MKKTAKIWEAAVIGGGIAGLSAAIYLGRAQRDAVVIDSNRSLALWEPEVQNYLGFPEGISGLELLKRGRRQAVRYGVTMVNDEIVDARWVKDTFRLEGRRGVYRACRILLATGLYHRPPEIPKVKECLGHSMFFCKDCDGHRVRGKRIAVLGTNNEAVEYCLGMLLFSSCVVLLTNGRKPQWDKRHAAWITEYKIPVYREQIIDVTTRGCQVVSVRFGAQTQTAVDAIFTTRGDVYHNNLGRALGVRVGREGDIIVDYCQRTSVPRVYAAGCITPANCQMVIAAGEGAAAAQAINRDLFEESLRNRTLRLYRAEQLSGRMTIPEKIRRKRGPRPANPGKFNPRSKRRLKAKG